MERTPAISRPPSESVAPPLADGRYQLIEILGQGGMATVYRAWDHRLGVERAIKVLSPALTRSKRLRARFEVEARTMARLSHRNILKVFDVAEDADRVFLVMELARGGALWDRVIAKGPLHPRLAVELVAEVAEALAVAHEHGVVHRDIKPQNILLTSDGMPRLTDFGIAQVQDPVLQQALTRTGTVMGTWAFMAPEQRTSARQVDPRTDLYALAATLYALLKGALPPDLFAAAMDDGILAGIDEGAAAVIEMATRYRAEERHQTATDLAAALRTLAASLPAIPEDSRSAALGVDPNAVSTPSFAPPSPAAAPPPARSGGSQTRSRSRSADTHPSLEPFDTSAGRESSGTLAAFIDEDEPPLDPPARPTPNTGAAGGTPPPLATRADPAMPARSPWRRPAAALALAGAVALLWWGSTGDPTVQAPTPPAGTHSAQPAQAAATTPTAPERPPPPEAATDPADAPPPSADAGEPSAPPPEAEATAPTQSTPEPEANPEPAPTATPPASPPDPSPDASPQTPAPAVDPEPPPEPEAGLEPEPEPEPALVFVDGDALEVVLQRDTDGERFAPGRGIPAGEYTVLVRFSGGSEAALGVGLRLQLLPGERARLTCDRTFQKCRKL